MRADPYPFPDVNTHLCLTSYHPDSLSLGLDASFWTVCCYVDERARDFYQARRASTETFSE